MIGVVGTQGEFYPYDSKVERSNGTIRYTNSLDIFAIDRVDRACRESEDIYVMCDKVSSLEKEESNNVYAKVKPNDPIGYYTTVVSDDFAAELCVRSLVNMARQIKYPRYLAGTR